MTFTRSSSFPVPPGGMIGILGGGQLGRMLSMAAARLGLKTHIYSDVDDAPALDLAAACTRAAYDDEPALAQFAQAVDAVTFEFENVPSATLAFLAERHPTHPDARALDLTQDRYTEKTFLRSLGIATTEFGRADSVKEAHAALASVGCPSILKTRRFGYDGKGQAKVASPADLERALDSLRHAPSILEKRVDFAFECSVIAARTSDGAFAAFDPPENQHSNQILRRSRVPSPLAEAQQNEAKAITKRIADALDYVGVLAVEYFVTKGGALLVNEIAPRVHNSGHWTLESCVVSQFEQHIRAVAGWPLGSPSRHSNAVMTNLIGEEAADWQALARAAGALHLYGKRNIRAGRKMGHVTRLLPWSGRSPAWD